MDKLKVMTIIGTRPEIIRLSACIKACDRYFHHILVHTGQNWDYTLNQVFFDDLGLRAPDYYLDSVGKDLAKPWGILSPNPMKYWRRKSRMPYCCWVIRIRLCLRSPQKRLKIPIFHMEAGNRCWDWNVSEMINRKIVDHISDINLPYTEHSRRYLLSEGIDGKTVFVTGSPMREVLRDHMDRIERSNILETLGLEKGKYILLSAHREENIDNEENFMSLMTAVNNIAEHYGMPIIYSTHPRSKKYIEKRGFQFHPLVRSLKPFGFLDYNKLQMNSYCVLSDSGTLSEESAMLGFAGVLIRTSTERPEVLDKGSVVIGGITGRDVEQALDLAVAMRDNREEVVMAEDYADTNVSVKVVKLIQSYTEIVNKTVWGK